MGKMLDWFKAHPLAGGLVVFGVGLILVLALFGGSSNSAQSAVVTDAPSDVGANSALVAAQLNAGVQIQTAQIQANVQMASIDAAKSIYNKQNDNQALAITTAADTSKYISTLQAQNDAASIDAAKAINAANLSTAQQVATIQANANTTIANITGQMNASNNATTLSLAAIQQDVINKQTAASQTVKLAQIAGINATNAQIAHNNLYTISESYLLDAYNPNPGGQFAQYQAVGTTGYLGYGV